MTDQPLDYIPALINAYLAGHASDHVHLGYWASGTNHDWITAQAAMTDLHLDALDLLDGQTIIDVGCGLGGTLRAINTRLSESTLIGVNIDPRQLEVCKMHQPRAENRFDWTESDACNVPLADQCADRVVSLEAMFHFPSRQKFIFEAARLMRPQARFVCSDIQFESPRTPAERHLLDIVKAGYAPWPDPIIHAGDIIKLGQDAGLSLIESNDISRHVLPTWEHIVSSREKPESSAVAAMAGLHRADLLRYQLYVFQRPAQD